jgi:hypothetical protein
VTDLVKVDGKEVILVPESPLMRSQDQQDIADLLRYNEGLQFILGEAAAGAQQPAELVAYLAQKHRIPDQLVPSKDEIGQRAQQAVQAAQQAGPQPR